MKDSSLKQALFSSTDSDRSLQDVINEKEDLQMKVLVYLFIILFESSSSATFTRWVLHVHVPLFNFFQYVMLFYSDSSNKQLESMRQKKNLHTEQVQQLKSDVNKLTSEKLQIDSDLQQRYKLEEDKAKLLSENDQYDKEVTVQSWNICIIYITDFTTVKSGV